MRGNDGILELHREPFPFTTLHAGKIPASLGQLHSLQALDLSGNQLSGERLQ